MHKQRDDWIVEAEIDAITDRAEGKGTYADKEGVRGLLHVPFTLPGERVIVKVLGKRKKLMWGRLEQVIKPSSFRVEARCQHHGACGGCCWQHLHYQEQLKIKQQRIQELFSPFCPLVRPIVASPQIWSYRNKMEFSFGQDAAGERYLGLFMTGYRSRVLDLKQCTLVSPWFVSVLQVTKQWWSRTQQSAWSHRGGTLRTLTLREGKRSGDRLVMLTVSGEVERIEEWVEALQVAVQPSHEIPEGTLSIYLRDQRVAKGVPTQFVERLLYGKKYFEEILYISYAPDQAPHAFTFHIAPTAFFQPNPQQAETLISHAIQQCQLKETDTVYDLYGGTGTLGICAAKRAQQVIGIEICAEAVENAKNNALLNGLANYQCFCGAVNSFASEESTLPKPDVVLLNPPRVGLDPQTLQWLLLVRPKRIVYISCNPITQQRDVLSLASQEYTVATIQPIDQFPHTLHVENIVTLSLKNPFKDDG